MHPSSCSYGYWYYVHLCSLDKYKYHTILKQTNTKHHVLSNGVSVYVLEIQLGFVGFDLVRRFEKKNNGRFSLPQSVWGLFGVGGSQGSGVFFFPGCGSHLFSIDRKWYVVSYTSRYVDVHLYIHLNIYIILNRTSHTIHVRYIFTHMCLYLKVHVGKLHTWSVWV